MKAASASTLGSSDSLAAPALPPAGEVAPFNSLAAVARGLVIGPALSVLSALAGIALASATVGYPIGGLG